jgi:hypothetical protein
MERAATNQVHMHVENGLTGSWPDVQHRAISIFDGAVASNAGSGEVAEANQLGVFRGGFLEPSDVLFWNYQNVSWTLRIQILKREDPVVFVNFLGRHLSAYDAAKKTV